MAAKSRSGTAADESASRGAEYPGDLALLWLRFEPAEKPILRAGHRRRPVSRLKQEGRSDGAPHLAVEQQHHHRARPHGSIDRSISWRRAPGDLFPRHRRRRRLTHYSHHRHRHRRRLAADLAGRPRAMAGEGGRRERKKMSQTRRRRRRSGLVMAAWLFITGSHLSRVALHPLLSMLIFFFLLFKAKAALLIVERPHRAVSCAAFFSFIFLSFSGDDL